MDGHDKGYLSAGVAGTLYGVQAGARYVEVHYYDGQKEFQNVIVERGKTVYAVFAYIPPPIISVADIAANLVPVAGGTFKMGSEKGDSDEKPVHTVTVSSFSISMFETTFAQFDAFCDATGWKKPGDEGWGRGNKPVINVTWIDAVEYCNWLSKIEDLTPCYSASDESIRCNFSANGYRLPTEAEWEYAAKGGIRSRGYVYAGSDNPGDTAWYDKTGGGRTHLAGVKKPNELGLYDMSGNVWEWCWDLYKAYTSSAQTDLAEITRNFSLVLRGGGWSSGTVSLRTTNRCIAGYPKEADYNFGGFRVARRP